jgi:hypothetical protein
MTTSNSMSVKAERAGRLSPFAWNLIFIFSRRPGQFRVSH